MKTRIILIFLVIGCLNLSAQPPETNYLGTVIKAGYDDDASYGPFNIGFTFNFCGNNYTQFYVNSNGMILFGTGSSESTVATIPTAAVPNNYIASFWDDLVIDPSGKILYTTIGASSNHKLVVQFTNMGFYTHPIILGTFQVILYETSNIIQVQYRQLCDNTSPRTRGGTATIGLENSNGTAGTLYSFMNPTAISIGQAISFTPPGPNYTVNSNAVYDGVYLTTNLSLPEPGITNLISPPENSVIGANQTFSWSSSSYATSYTLRISYYSDLTAATVYNAGTNLSYDVTGLTLDTVYYWGVFASNTTGTTWSQITKFRTSSTPPLAPAPETDWVEQGNDITIQLDYTGGDASAKTGIITSLPANGSLYQYNAGVRGAQITSVPTTLTDTSRKVIYFASGITGNGAGNFNFKIHDNTGDSPEATVTINVSPPGVPNVLYVAKSTTNVEIQFDIQMADPTGKQNQFTIKVNGTPVTINSAGLKPNDPYTIVLTLAASLTGSETVLVSYTPGDIAGSTGGLLLPFTFGPVTLLAQTITFSTNLNKVYGDLPFGLSATSTSGLTAFTYSSSNLSVATISGNTLTIHAAGTADITARQAGNATYAPAKYIKPLTVSKALLTVTADPKTKTYGAANPALTFQYSGWKYSDDPSKLTTLPTASTTVNLTTPVGIYTGAITVAGGASGNYNFTYVAASFTVNKAVLTVTADAKTKVYGAANPALTFKYSGWQNGEDSTYLTTLPAASTTVTILSPVAIYTNDITVSGGVDDNYDFTYVPADFTVTKAMLTVTADAKTKTYGAANPPLTFRYSGWQNGEDSTYLTTLPTASTTVTILSPVAIYTNAITVSGGADDNYDFTYVPADFTVTKAMLTVTADAKTKTYGASNPALTFQYSGWQNGDNEADLTTVPIATTTVTVLSPVGTYANAITLSGGADDNYDFTYVPADFTVTKAMLTVTADAKTKTYGAANPALTFQYSGWQNGDTEADLTTVPIATTTVTVLSPVGTYANAITLSGGADDNYDFTFVPADFTVSGADLTFTAEDKTKVFEQPNPDLTYIISGFVNGETQTVLDVLPSIQTTALLTSPVGTYPITISGGSDDNYNYIYVDGTLTITRYLQTITFTDIPERLLVGDSYTLVASSTSGLTVSFESLDPLVATVEGTQLTGVSKGNARIRAYHPGDINYEPAEVVDTVEVYSTHKDIMYLFTPNGDGFNDYWELPKLQDWGKCDVKVYNRWGKLVYANPDYNNLWDGTSAGNPVPEGAYYFVIKTENAGIVKGTVNIVR